MRRNFPLLPGLGLALGLALWASIPSARAGEPPDWNAERVLPPNVDLGLPPVDNAFAPPRPDRIRLFRIMPAFASDPPGLEDEPTSSDLTPTKDDGPDWLQLAIGNDNPYFDIRLPGDPGGIGYTRVVGQVQLLDLPRTSFAVSFQAVTPTGAQSGGVEDGPTVVRPAFSVFQSLGDGAAFQGFVCKELHFANPAGLGDTLLHPGQLERTIEYGLAVQRPLHPQLDGVFLFVEALGRYRYDTVQPAAYAATTTATWNLVPGMHLKVTDNWWLSGGLILPVDTERPIDARMWQITCSFRF